jgi:deoxyribodipyrimidine photo-lyase
MEKVTIFWHRRDLRIEDNAGLFHALKNANNVLPIFIFDTNILSKLEDKNDARASFIHQEVEKIKKEYETFGGSLLVRYGNPVQIWQQLTEEYSIEAVFTNRDYEPYASQRDKQIFDFLTSLNIPFKGFKDHVIFDKNEIVKDDGKPYTVYTPFSKKWKVKLNPFYLKAYPSENLLKNLLKTAPLPLISLAEMGFSKSTIPFPTIEVSKEILSNYHKTRDFPAINGTSRISLHLRFGTISIRKLATTALQLNEKYLNELIWRDFYHYILYHFPHTTDRAFKPEYDQIEWENNETHFEKWCNGTTGYPIVDAGMRELNQTGYMHNRVRMVVASFLTKHLLIDWRWGEVYFAKKLLDFDLAANVGGWQWAAGSGCDAAPYFRVFNPYLQTIKFDSEEKYIKKWIPEYQLDSYPKPIINHDFARKRVLDRYAKALKNK